MKKIFESFKDSFTVNESINDIKWKIKNYLKEFSFKNVNDESWELYKDNKPQGIKITQKEDVYIVSKEKHTTFLINFDDYELSTLKKAQDYIISFFYNTLLVKSKYFYFVVDLDERGEYAATVYDAFGDEVYSIDTNTAHELIEDGFLKYKPEQDLYKFGKYLISLGILPKGSEVYTEDEFDNKVGILESENNTDVYDDFNKLIKALDKTKVSCSVFLMKDETININLGSNYPEEIVTDIINPILKKLKLTKVGIQASFDGYKYTKVVDVNGGAKDYDYILK
jgi:hypothetical protein